MGPRVPEVYPAWWSDPGLTGGREEGGPGVYVVVPQLCHSHRKPHHAQGQAAGLPDCKAPAALTSLAPADSDALQFAVDSCGSGAGCTVLLSRPLDLPKPVVWNPVAGAFATARGMLRSARGGKGRLA